MAVTATVPRADDVRDNFRDDDGHLFLVRCPACRRENYGPAVASGQCAWCGWWEAGDGEPEQESGGAKDTPLRAWERLRSRALSGEATREELDRLPDAAAALLKCAARAWRV